MRLFIQSSPQHTPGSQAPSKEARAQKWTKQKGRKNRNLCDGFGPFRKEEEKHFCKRSTYWHEAETNNCLSLDLGGLATSARLESLCVCVCVCVCTCEYTWVHIHWMQGLSLPRKVEATSWMATMRMMNAKVWWRVQVSFPPPLIAITSSFVLSFPFLFFLPFIFTKSAKLMSTTEALMAGTMVHGIWHMVSAKGLFAEMSSF